LLDASQNKRSTYQPRSFYILCPKLRPNLLFFLKENMYTLFKGLYKYLTSKEEYYAIILGLDNAGKTVWFIASKFECLQTQ
jgi:hypothetical protein